jgi:hypothetical protein
MRGDSFATRILPMSHIQRDKRQFEVELLRQ